MHYTRTINLKELILEFDCLDESTVEALENTETGIESYEVEYTVTRKGGDDYKVLPSPFGVASSCGDAFNYAMLEIGQYVTVHGFLAVINGIGRDAEWWEGENRDMLIELSEDRFDG